MLHLSKDTFVNWFNRETILSLALGFVVIWFGLNEIVDTKNWIGYLPEFIWESPFAATAVITHGVILSITGVMLVLNFHRRIAAAILTFILAELVISLLYTGVSGETIVRDVGLLGIAVALLLKK